MGLSDRLLAAISWLDRPLIDDATPLIEIRQRIAFMMADRDRALREDTSVASPIPGMTNETGNT